MLRACIFQIWRYRREPGTQIWNGGSGSTGWTKGKQSKPLHPQVFSWGF